MVQGHPKKVNTCPGFWYSSHGCGFEGSICTGFGSESYMRFPGSSEYRTSYLGGYPYEQRCACQSEEFGLCGFEESGRETEGFMLNITGLNRFFFVCNFHDMRCKYDKVLSIIHQQLNCEPEDGDVFIVMSKDYVWFTLIAYFRKEAKGRGSHRWTVVQGWWISFHAKGCYNSRKAVKGL